MSIPARQQSSDAAPLREAVVRAAPSLAMIKYWGKVPGGANLPATPSIAVTLRHLHTETRVRVLDRRDLPPATGDLVILDGQVQDAAKAAPFFAALRQAYGGQWVFRAESRNNFPTAAGLASSSSGYAALACAASLALGRQDPPEFLSALARTGSGSAARSLYGGFTLFPAGSTTACALAGPEFWPELAVLVVRVEDGPKEVSSRHGMEHSRLTSPYYSQWVADAGQVCDRAQAALQERDLANLGPLIRQSYLRMFSTMFSADPPFIYWKPLSLQVILACEELRREGILAWETMDAGPQVKIFCLKHQVGAIRERLLRILDASRLILDEAGPGPGACSPGLLGGPDPRLDPLQAESPATSRQGSGAE